MKKLLGNLIYPLAVFLIVLLVWYIACFLIDVDLILPSPSQAFIHMWEYLKDATFWISFGWTYLRCIEGFLIAFGIALFLSILSYTFFEVEKFLKPFMAIVRAVPTMAILLILIIMISPSQTPIIVAGIVICPILYQSFLTGFHQIDRNLIEMANVYQVSKKDRILKFFIPSMKPILLDTTATSFSLNIKLVIAAEALAQTRNSIGKLMQISKVNLEVEKLFALTIIAVVISIISEAGLHMLKKVLCHD